MKIYISFFVCCFIRRELMDWSYVDYCDAFIRCLYFCSDGTHSLQKVHW